MKKILLPILATAAFILALGVLAKTSPTFNSQPAKIETNKSDSVKVGAKEIKVEIADTEAKRSLGLGKRSSLPKDQGMLFVFGHKQIVPNFWMKDMEFSIDIIWISEGKVVKIDKDAKAEKGVDSSKLKIYSPGQPIDYVLEVNSGFTDTNKISVGQTVTLPSGY